MTELLLVVIKYNSFTGFESPYILKIKTLFLWKISELLRREYTDETHSIKNNKTVTKLVRTHVLRYSRAPYRYLRLKCGPLIEWPSKQDVESMVFQRWISVEDDGPTLKQHLYNALEYGPLIEWPNQSLMDFKVSQRWYAKPKGRFCLLSFGFA